MFEIRPLAAGDFAEVSALWEATEGLGVCGPREPFERYLDRNPGMSPVAISDGRIIGAVQCGDDGHRGYLYHLAVAESHRGNGVARALVDWCLDRLAQRNIARCSIFLYHENLTGESFWHQIGWRERVDLKVMAMDIGQESRQAGAE